MEAVHVVGAGGIGCAVGHALSSAGVRVTFVEADPRKVEWGRRNGVAVAGHPDRPADFVPFAGWQPAADAVVLLCTKCYDNAAVLTRLRDDTPLVPIQNGFDPALDARGHGTEAIASFVSECEPGRARTHITRRGKLHVGGRAGSGPAAPSWLAEALRSSRLFAVREVPAIGPFKHTKLLYNAAVSPIAAAAGLDNGSLLAVPEARRLFFDLLRENYRILRSAGIELGTIGPFHPDRVDRILRRRWLANLLAVFFYPSLRGTYCSMAPDLPRGRTEIDYYNGHLVRLAAGATDCPLNRRVVELIRRMERQRVAPHRGALIHLSDDGTRRAA
jgi:2-dehydropantoate 2-reductase